MLREAIEAMRMGDRYGRTTFDPPAQTNQNNPTYWVWLSSVVDTQKESLYCLNTALKLDTKNIAANRGLVLLGGLPPTKTCNRSSSTGPRMGGKNSRSPKESEEKTRGWADTIKRLIRTLAITVVAAGY